MMSSSLAFTPAAAAAQRRRFAATYSVLEEAIAQHAFPGAAFAVLAADRVVALDGLGRFTYDPASPAVSPATVYDLASVTKVVATTAMAMLLYGRGRLILDQPLVELLPAFTAPPVTLRMLLAHASGLPGYARLFTTAANREELLQACLALPLTSAPGSHSEYSDPGFILLGEALETLAGESLDNYCSRELFAPLGMRSTCFRPVESSRAAIPPTENDEVFRHRVVQGVVQDENCFMLGGVAGHAGLFSDALDLLRFARCVLQGSGPHLFTPGALDLFTRRAGLPPGSSRALGWDTPSAPSSSGKYFSLHSAGHLGFAGTSLWIDLERGIGVVLLTNRTWPRRENQAIKGVRPRFHDSVLEALEALPAQKEE